MHQLATAPLALAAAIALAGCTATETDTAPATTPVTSASEAAGTEPASQADAGRGASRTLDSPFALGQAPHLNDACRAATRYDRYKVDGGDWTWSITGSRADTGVADYATGTPNADLTEYVVAPGDSITGIGARFCVDYVHLMLINHRGSDDIYAGETIRLFPDGVAADYVIDPDAQASPALKAPSD